MSQKRTGAQFEIVGLLGASASDAAASDIDTRQLPAFERHS